MTTPPRTPTSSGIWPVAGGVMAGAAAAGSVFAAAPALIGPEVEETMRIVLAVAAGSIAALIAVVALSVIGVRRGAAWVGEAHSDAPARAPVLMSELELTDIVLDDPFPAVADPAAAAAGIQQATVGPRPAAPMALAPGERIKTFQLGSDPTLAERMLARMTWERAAAA